METRAVQIEQSMLDRINSAEKVIAADILDEYFGREVDGARPNTKVRLHKQQIGNAVYEALGQYEYRGLFARQPGDEELDELVQTVSEAWTPEAFKPDAKNAVAEYGDVTEQELLSVLEGTKIIGIQLNIIGEKQLTPETEE